MTTHELRFYGLADGSISIRCARPGACSWSTVIEPGHSLADLNRLAAQHTGTEQEASDG